MQRPAAERARTQRAARTGPRETAVRLAGWAVGMPVATYRYLTRRIPLSRDERVVDDLAASFPVADGPDVQRHDAGVGPPFHRVYAIRFAGARVSSEQLLDVICADPNVASPTEVTVFTKTVGEPHQMAVGDEYLIRMPGPWNGPVRVIDRSPTSFRFATLDGHMEAGVIEFRARGEGDHTVFEIESWARSASRLQDLLYHRLRLSREMQLHLWAHFLQRACQIAGGRPLGGVRVLTECEAGGSRA
jgi:Domain of unknown function (DUF1990)